MMKRVMGIDGGGSKTTALVTSQAGHVLGWARADGSNHESIGFRQAERVLTDLARKAMARAGMEHPTNVAVWALAGADVGSDFATLRTMADRIAAAERNIIVNDVRAVMWSGLSRSWGVGIVSGVGFNACGIAPDGRILQLPALGETTGDWGGGAVIGRETLRMAHRSYDGREVESVLRKRVPEALGFSSFAELPDLVRANALDDEAVRDVLPRVLFAAAEDGDAVAGGIVARIGKEVGVTAATLLDRLGMAELDTEIVLGGSILRAAVPQLIAAIRAELTPRAPNAMLIRPEIPPVIGAVYHALRTLGIEITEETRRNVHTTLPAELADDGESGCQGKGTYPR